VRTIRRIPRVLSRTVAHYPDRASSRDLTFADLCPEHPSAIALRGVWQTVEIDSARLS
jgi:hypothetical protein